MCKPHAAAGSRGRAGRQLLRKARRVRGLLTLLLLTLLRWNLIRVVRRRIELLRCLGLLQLLLGLSELLLKLLNLLLSVLHGVVSCLWLGLTDGVEELVEIRLYLRLRTTGNGDSCRVRLLKHIRQIRLACCTCHRLRQWIEIFGDLS